MRYSSEKRNFVQKFTTMQELRELPGIMESSTVTDDELAAVATVEKTYTIAEYLDAESIGDVRHEFHNGIIIQMAGGIIPHNAVKGDLFTLINMAIRNMNTPHVALNSDTKIRIERENRFVYPDATVSDGMPEYYSVPAGKIRRDVIVNPLIVVEVLSEDTRSYDKSEKFELYSSLSTFREYVLIEPEICWIKSYYLQDPAAGLWKIQTITDETSVLTFHSLGIEIKIADIYAVLKKLPQ